MRPQRPRPLQSTDDLTGFESGEESLDAWQALLGQLVALWV